MLIVEGADLVGKTTLCEALVRELSRREHGYVYRHLTKLPNGFVSPWAYMQLASRRVVQDRFHMSEVLYAKARHERPVLSPFGYALVDAHLRQLGAFTVIVTTSRDQIADRWRAGEMYDLDTVLAINDDFESVALGQYESRYVMDHDYHYQGPSPTGVIGDILDKYSQRQAEFDAILSRRPVSWR